MCKSTERWLLFVKFNEFRGDVGMKTSVDKTDLLILRELRENCKRPVRELAQILHIHPNTLLQRIKKLEKSKVIRKYTADIDYRAIGYDMHAIVNIRIKKRGLEDENLLKQVTGIPEVQSLYAVTGGSDCIAIIKAKNRDDLVRVLQIIQTQETVLRTTSYIVLLTYKESVDFNPLKD